jgi:hypothetical protein
MLNTRRSPQQAPRKPQRDFQFAMIAAIFGVAALMDPARGQPQPFQPTYEDGVTRRGQDYRSFQPVGPSALYCQQACVSETQCKAWSYDSPEVTREKQPKCWLKSGIPSAQTAGGIISGVVRPDENTAAVKPPGEQSDGPGQPDDATAVVFNNFDLMGTFAQDCSKPASNDNYYYVHDSPDPSRAQRVRMNGPDARDYVNVFDKAYGIGPKEIVVSGTRVEGRFKGQPIREVWRIEANRHMTLESKVGGTKIVSNGRFNGRPAAWLYRCSTPPAQTAAQPAVQAATQASNSGAASALATTVKAVFDKYNLYGVYATDCSKPAKAVENWYAINRPIDGGRVQRDLMGSPTSVTSVTIIDKASELRPNEIAVSGTYDGKPAEGVWHLDKNRMRPWSAKRGDEQTVANGKWVKTGADMPWTNRCD